MSEGQETNEGIIILKPAADTLSQEFDVNKNRVLEELTTKISIALQTELKAIQRGDILPIMVSDNLDDYQMVYPNKDETYQLMLMHTTGRARKLPIPFLISRNQGPERLDRVLFVEVPKATVLEAKSKMLKWHRPTRWLETTREDIGISRMPVLTTEATRTYIELAPNTSITRILHIAYETATEELKAFDITFNWKDGAVSMKISSRYLGAHNPRWETKSAYSLKKDSEWYNTITNKKPDFDIEGKIKEIISKLPFEHFIRSSGGGFEKLQ